MFEHVGHPRAATLRSRSFKRRMTSSEQRLWKELRVLDANIRRQAPVGRYFADFACHAQKPVIEVDGEVHDRLAEVAARDLERQHWLEGEGYRVLRFTNRQVQDDIDGCINAVKALLLDGGGLGGGVAGKVTEALFKAPTPNSASRLDALRTPPSPTLPPSRRKGV
jgi:very-short-patch-repair endonuclease